MRKVVLLTDMKDIALAEVQLRTLAGLDNSMIQFINVSLPAFDMLTGNFQLRLLADSLENDDIVIVVLDPRSQDRPHNSLGILFENGVYVFGPNNGVMSWMIKDFPIKTIVKLPDNENTLKHPTFNGKYKFSLAANQILKGEKIEKTGETFDLNSLYSFDPKPDQIVHIDNYGNLKINKESLTYAPGQKLTISFGDQKYPATFGKEFDEVSVGNIIVYTGSSLHGLPEIAINNGDAAKYLGAKVGDMIHIEVAN